MSINIEGLEIVSMPAEQYHATPAIGHSSLVKLMRSPAHYRNYKDTPHEPTPTMAFGTALHTAVLEPELFPTIYVACEKFDRRTKVGKEAALEWEAKNQGMIGLEPSQMESIKNIQLAVKAHVAANQYLARGYAELSVFWVDQDTGIACKSRPDFLVLDENGEVDSILDLKTSQDAGQAAFAKSIANYGYDLQAAFYSDPFSAALGKEIPFRFLAVESEAPNAAAVYRTGPATLELGRKKYRGALQLLDWCQQHDAWPSYQPYGTEEVIEVPHWATKLTLIGDSED